MKRWFAAVALVWVLLGLVFIIQWQGISLYSFGLLLAISGGTLSIAYAGVLVLTSRESIEFFLVAVATGLIFLTGAALHLEAQTIAHMLLMSALVVLFSAAGRLSRRNPRAMKKGGEYMRRDL